MASSRKPSYQYGIIILTRDRPDLLRTCLEHLQQTMNGGYRPRIHIWNNGSDEETPIIAKQFGAELYERSGENVSFAAANNHIASQFSGDVFLLNNDVFVQPGCLEAMVEERKKGCDIVGAKLLYPDGRIQHYGIGFSREYWAFHLCRFAPQNDPWSMDARVVPAVTGACCLISREVWDSLEGFDEQFIFGFEDIDFCLRAREAGNVIGVIPTAMAFHLESQTAGRSSFDLDNLRKYDAKWIRSSRVFQALGVWPMWINQALQNLHGPDAMLMKSMIE